MLVVDINAVVMLYQLKNREQDERNILHCSSQLTSYQRVSSLLTSSLFFEMDTGRSSSHSSIFELKSRKPVRDLLLTSLKILSHPSKVKHRYSQLISVHLPINFQEHLRSTLFPSTFAPIYQLLVCFAPAGRIVASKTSFTCWAQLSAASGLVSMEVWWCSAMKEIVCPIQSAVLSIMMGMLAKGACGPEIKKRFGKVGIVI
jgi:hypothetical protein